MGDFTLENAFNNFASRLEKLLTGNVAKVNMGIFGTQNVSSIGGKTFLAAADGMMEAANLFGKAASTAYKSGIVQTGGYTAEEMLSLSDAMSLINEHGFSFKTLLGGIDLIANQIAYQFQMEADVRAKINEETGLTGELAEGVKNEIFEAYPGVLNLGYGIEKITELYKNLIENTGKFTLLNSETLVRSAEVSRAFVGDLEKMGEVISQFEKVGIGATTALETIEDVGVKSLSLGLRSKTTVEDIRKNIEKLNQYGFKNGIEGLAAMSRKATEFRMNMEAAFKLADEVINPEGAVEMSANLQVLGGAIGDFADPLKMMYMATNDVEGLQDALIGASKSLATYNVEQGRFEVSGANLRRARDMAKALNMDLGDLTRTSVAAAERAQAATDLLSTGFDMSDEDREFLTNLGTMKDGQMVIQVPDSLTEKLSLPTEIAVGNLTKDIKDTLLKNKDAFEKMDSRQLAENQLTTLTRIERNIGTMAAMARIQATKAIKETDLYKDLDVLSNEFEAWSGGKIQDYVKGNLDFNSKEGQELQALMTKDLGEAGAKQLKERMEAMKKHFDEQNITPEQRRENFQIGTMRHLHYHSATNAIDAVTDAVQRDPELNNIYLSDRDYRSIITYYWNL